MVSDAWMGSARLVKGVEEEYFDDMRRVPFFGIRSCLRRVIFRALSELFVRSFASDS